MSSLFFSRKLANVAGRTTRLLQGKYDEAEPFCRRAMDIVETTLGRDHTSCSTSLINLAGLLQEQVRAARLSNCDMFALVLFRYIWREPTHAATRPARLPQGKYDEAEALYRRALAITELILGSDNPSCSSY